jgi:hypothetical protein
VVDGIDQVLSAANVEEPRVPVEGDTQVVKSWAG